MYCAKYPLLIKQIVYLNGYYFVYIHKILYAKFLNKEILAVQDKNTHSHIYKGKKRRRKKKDFFFSFLSEIKLLYNQNKMLNWKHTLNNQKK